jgi:hypothetical protein
MIDHAKAAIARRFWIFSLQPRSKYPLPGSHAHKDARGPADPLALQPWKQHPTYNVGIATGESGLIVLDFETLADVPEWLNKLKTFKVLTSRGVHIYFWGTRRSGKLIIAGKIVGDIKSNGAFVLAAGSVHPSGKRYEVLDDSPVAPMPDAVAALLNESTAAVTPISVSRSGEPIPYGAHYDTLFKIACAYRGKNLDREHIELLLVYDCEARCIDYGADYLEMCRDISESVMRYAANVQGRGACVSPGFSPFCSKCHEPQGPAQIKMHKIIYRKGIVEQPLCLLCQEEIKRMNFTMLNVKPTTGKLQDSERWIVWQAFIGLPKRSFLDATIDQQERYIRGLYDEACRLGELASSLTG